MRDHAHLALGDRTRARPRDLGADLDRLRRRHLHPAYPSPPTVDSGRGRLAREPRRGPAGDPRSVARRGARGGLPRAGGRGARHRDEGRRALGAHGARPRHRRARPPLLHEPREPEGSGARGEPRGRARLLLGPAASAPGARRGGGGAASRDEESLEYFRTRARESRLGAWASPQSRPLADRGELDRLYADVEQRFGSEDDVPLPPSWGGYRVVPRAIELWQNRPNRLHDRARYERDGDGWSRVRLAPCSGLSSPRAPTKGARARSSCTGRRRSRGGTPSPPAAARRAPAASPAPAGSSSPGSTGSAARRSPWSAA